MNQFLSGEGKKLRKTITQIVNSGGASHIGTSFSCVEILKSIYNNVDVEKIKNNDPLRDRVIVSKGHSAAAVYTVLYHHGLMDLDTLQTYHQNGSLLSGHVSHFVEYIEHSTGALGHGLSVAVGCAMGLKRKGATSKVYVVLGDGELNEGSNWEAMMLASQQKLDNLIVFVDDNKLGGIRKTSECCSIYPLFEKFTAFGFDCTTIDGHDEQKLQQSIDETIMNGKPTAIVCDTIKGKGISFMENENVWHYRPVSEESMRESLAELEE